MQEQLIIPEQIQLLLNEIHTKDISLGEIQIDEHPLLPSFHRFIKINKMVIDTELPRTYLFYQQVLRNKETNEIEPSNLPTPEWMIGEDEWSSLRDEQFNRVQVPIVDSETLEPLLDDKGNPRTSILKVNTHLYMFWLLKNNKVGFLDLLKIYLKDFVDVKRSGLDKLS